MSDESSKEDIIRLPEINKFVGSCPTCGHNIRELDELRMRKLENPHMAIYLCIECKEQINAKDLIPF